MSKVVRRALRISESLDREIELAAKRRGMNWSEMVRHILTNYFFNGTTGREEAYVKRDA